MTQSRLSGHKCRGVQIVSRASRTLKGQNPDEEMTMKTDVQLQKDVVAELSWEPSVDSGKIGVEVIDGIVTLAGYVTSYAEKRAAEKAVQRVSGVRALAVELDVAVPGVYQRHDSDIARTAENVLSWVTSLPKDMVKVMVEDGWVTLSGQVEWDYQRRAAARVVRDLMGVTGVTNQITIKAKAFSTTIKSEIEAALKRRANSDAQNIFVNVTGADVTLSGTVQSWSEHDLATRAAWGTPGVSKVVDNIAIRQ
jgi:osmotically-inducible protein OsmY